MATQKKSAPKTNAARTTAPVDNRVVATPSRRSPSVMRNIEDLIAAFAEQKIPLEGDFADLIELADIGRKAAGLNPKQQGRQGDGLKLEGTGQLAVNTKADGGVHIDNGQLALKVEPDKGLDVTPGGLKIKTGKGFKTDAGGLQLDVDLAGLTQMEKWQISSALVDHYHLLPLPRIDHAIGNVIAPNSFTGDTTVRIAPWPGIALGQIVWMTYSGVKADGTAYLYEVWPNGSGVIERELQGGSYATLTNAALGSLKPGSLLEITLRVNFNQQYNKDQAIVFPRQSFLIVEFVGLETAANTLKVKAGSGIVAGAAGVAVSPDIQQRLLSVDAVSRLSITERETIARLLYYSINVPTSTKR